MFLFERLDFDGARIGIMKVMSRKIKKEKKKGVISNKKIRKGEEGKYALYRYSKKKCKKGHLEKVRERI